MLQSVLINKISASEPSRNLIKSALLVGKIFSVFLPPPHPPLQSGPGIVVDNARAQKSLTRLAVCLETLYDGGLQHAKFWIVPICRRCV